MLYVHVHVGSCAYACVGVHVCTRGGQRSLLYFLDYPLSYSLRQGPSVKLDSLLTKLTKLVEQAVSFGVCLSLPISRVTGTQRRAQPCGLGMRELRFPHLGGGCFTDGAIFPILTFSWD